MSQQAKSEWEITISGSNTKLLRYLKQEIEEELEYRDYLQKCREKEFPLVINYIGVV
jgi:hypothetical protein